MNKKADYILDRDLKKSGYRESTVNSGVYYKGNDVIHTDKLVYSHQNKSAVNTHQNGKSIK